MALNWKELLVSLTITPSNRNYNCKQDLRLFMNAKRELWLDFVEQYLSLGIFVNCFFSFQTENFPPKIPQILVILIWVTVASSFLVHFSLSAASHHWFCTHMSVSTVLQSVGFSCMQVPWFVWSASKLPCLAEFLDNLDIQFFLTPGANSWSCSTTSFFLVGQV